MGLPLGYPALAATMAGISGYAIKRGAENEEKEKRNVKPLLK